MHLRVTADGKLKTCLHYDDEDIDYRIEMLYDNITTFLKRNVDYHNKAMREK